MQRMLRASGHPTADVRPIDRSSTTDKEKSGEVCFLTRPIGEMDAPGHVTDHYIITTKL